MEKKELAPKKIGGEILRKKVFVDKEDWTQDNEERAQWSAPATAAYIAPSILYPVLKPPYLPGTLECLLGCVSPP